MIAENIIQDSCWNNVDQRYAFEGREMCRIAGNLAGEKFRINS